MEVYDVSKKITIPFIHGNLLISLLLTVGLEYTEMVQTARCATDFAVVKPTLEDLRSWKG